MNDVRDVDLEKMPTESALGERVEPITIPPPTAGTTESKGWILGEDLS